MEVLLDLLPALLIFWVVLRALRGSGRGRSRQRAAARTGTGPADGGRPASGFEELVRRLEMAAAEAQERQRGASTPPPPPVQAPVRPPRSVEGRKGEPFAFRSQEAPIKREFRFVGGIGEGEQEAEFHEAHPLEVPPLASGRPAATRAVHPLVSRLRNPASAREALILRDILSPPRSRSGHGGSAR